MPLVMRAFMDTVRQNKFVMRIVTDKDMVFHVQLLEGNTWIIARFANGQAHLSKGVIRYHPDNPFEVLIGDWPVVIRECGVTSANNAGKLVPELLS